MGATAGHGFWLTSVKNMCHRCIEKSPAQYTVHEYHFATYNARKKPYFMDNICTWVDRVCRVSDKYSHTGR